MVTFIKKSTNLSCIMMLLICLFQCLNVRAGIIDFETEKWELKPDSSIVQYLDRKCLKGSATLKNVDFQNGEIEVDVAFEGGRCYPGIHFRIQNDQNKEQLYFRPHRQYYSDVLQYTPVFNGVAGWQLYSGDGFTAGANLPSRQWIHVTLKVLGTEAKVFLGNSDEPALIIHDLKHGISRGTIGLFGPTTGQAYFANFSLTHTDKADTEKYCFLETPPGIIKDWSLSQSFKLSEINVDKYPDVSFLEKITWQQVQSAPDGLVDIARFRGRTGSEPDCIYARTTILADKEHVKQLSFGYSDTISIFLNGEIIFFGNSAYQYRDPSFLGIVGLFDTVFLPLQQGENELHLLIAESFGGWGFIFRDETQIFMDNTIKQEWEITSLSMPESAVYDPKRNRIYVSNFGRYDPPGSQFISIVSLDGQVTEAAWIKGLAYPTGMMIFDDKLYIVERSSVVEVDLQSGSVLHKIAVPQPKFLNDIAITPSGDIFVSDSRKSVIFKYSNTKWEEWLSNDIVQNPNGLLFYQDKLLVGNNGDNSLKAVDLATKKVTVMTNFNSGIIDGIKTDGLGNFYISHYEGKLFRLSQAGKLEKIIDSTGPGKRTADFDYIPGKKMLIIPGLETNNIRAFTINTK